MRKHTHSEERKELIFGITLVALMVLTFILFGIWKHIDGAIKNLLS